MSYLIGGGLSDTESPIPLCIHFLYTYMYGRPKLTLVEVPPVRRHHGQADDDGDGGGGRVDALPVHLDPTGLALHALLAAVAVVVGEVGGRGW